METLVKYGTFAFSLIAALVATTYAFGLWRGRKDRTDEVTAEHLADKPDRRELTTMTDRLNERIERVEGDHKIGLSRIEVILAKIESNQQHEHARRSDQIQEVFLELKRIMVDMAGLRATVEASNRADQEWRGGIERRLSVVEQRTTGDGQLRGRRKDDGQES